MLDRRSNRNSDALEVDKHADPLDWILHSVSTRNLLGIDAIVRAYFPFHARCLRVENPNERIALQRPFSSEIRSNRCKEKLVFALI